MMEVNFYGSVYAYWAGLPELRRTRGTFVQVGSALSYRGIPLQAAYCASKAALRTFFESARVELRKEKAGVDVCVILPGAINTPQFDRGRQKLGHQPKPIQSLPGDPGAHGRFGEESRAGTLWTALRLRMPGLARMAHEPGTKLR